jgi:hyperosmotically inducible periplasmic protein
MMKLRTIAAVAAVATLGLAGCDRTDRPERAAAPSPATPSPASPSPATPPQSAPAMPSQSPSAGAPPVTSPGAERSVGQTVDDAGITAKVKAALVAEKDVSGMSINVDTKQGKVTLTGKVPDPSHAERAIQVARGVEGVKAVENKLTVGAS